MFNLAALCRVRICGGIRADQAGIDRQRLRQQRRDLTNARQATEYRLNAHHAKRLDHRPKQDIRDPAACLRQNCDLAAAIFSLPDVYRFNTGKRKVDCERNRNTESQNDATIGYRE